MCISLTRPFALTVLSFLLAGAPILRSQDAAPVNDGTRPWRAERLDSAKLSEALTQVSKELQAIAPDVDKSSAAGKKRPALERRIELLKQIIDVVQESLRLEVERKALPGEAALLEKSIEDLGGLSPARAPEAATRDRAVELGGKLEVAQKKFEEARQLDAERNERAKRAAELRRSYGERAESAKKATRVLAEEYLAAENAAKPLITFRLENAGIEERLASEGLRLLEAEAEFEKRAAPYRTELIDHLERALKRKQEEHTLYQGAMTAVLEKEKEARATELAEKERAVDEAVTESARFLADYEAFLAGLRAEAVDQKAWLSKIADLDQWYNDRIRYVKDRRSTLEALLDDAAGSGRAGRRLRDASDKLRALRRRQPPVSVRKLSAALEEHRGRSSDIEDELLALSESWVRKLQKALSDVAEESQEDYRSRAARLEREVRSELRALSDQLFALIAEEEKIQAREGEFARECDKLEEFLLPRLVWVRDAEAFGLGTVESVGEELSQLAAWFRRVGQARAELGAALRTSRALFLGVLIVLVIPTLLVLGRALRRGLRAQAQKTLRAIFFAVLYAALFPTFLYIVAFVCGAVSLPASLGLALENLLGLLAFFLLVYLVLSVLFFTRPHC